MIPADRCGDLIILSEKCDECLFVSVFIDELTSFPESFTGGDIYDRTRDTEALSQS